MKLWEQRQAHDDKLAIVEERFRQLTPKKPNPGYYIINVGNKAQINSILSEMGWELKSKLINGRYIKFVAKTAEIV
jgi:hypothetical protein